MNTPRTDALKKYVSDFPKTVDEWAEWTAQYCQLARQLERELIATRERAEKAEAMYDAEEKTELAAILERKEK